MVIVVQKSEEKERRVSVFQGSIPLWEELISKSADDLPYNRIADKLARDCRP